MYGVITYIKSFFINASRPEAVGKFYDNNCDAFSRVYGDVIQAFRTTDVTKLLHYQARAMSLKPGMKILDAGCGVCGPAIFFSENYGVVVDAVTVSEKQVAIAKNKIVSAGLSGKVTICKGDYHQLASIFPENSYDVVYFLESFGHSQNKAKAIHAAWQMLKPGGLLYIKDLFVKETIIPRHIKQIKKNIFHLNKAYRYNVGNLYDCIRHIRRKGFILSSLKTIDISLEDFENLTISNEFQELTGIYKIDDLQSYIFPVDFFELFCIKPWYEAAKGANRYFLQNLYHLQILNSTQDDL